MSVLAPLPGDPRTFSSHLNEFASTKSKLHSTEDTLSSVQVSGNALSLQAMVDAITEVHSKLGLAIERYDGTVAALRTYEAPFSTSHQRADEAISTHNS